MLSHDTCVEVVMVKQFSHELIANTLSLLVIGLYSLSPSVFEFYFKRLITSIYRSMSEYYTITLYRDDAVVYQGNDWYAVDELLRIGDRITMPCGVDVTYMGWL